MTLYTSLSRFLPALALAVLLIGSAAAQDTGSPESNDDARAEYGAAIEAAQEASAQGTADGYAIAGEHYLQAAAAAEESGDEELQANVRPVREAAVRAFVDAGSSLASQQAFDQAGEHFMRAADAARDIGDSDLEARVTSNAGTAFLQGEDFERAITMFDRAAELNPENLDFVHLRAVALRGSGDSEAALAAFNELADRAEAADDAHNLSRAHEGAGRIHLMAAREAIQAQDFRGAIASLDQASEFLAADDANLNTFYANAYYRLGVGQVQAEQFTTARTSLQRAQEHARAAGRDQIVQGAQAQLDYIREVLNN